jgi:cytoskeletal protein RodZ
MDEQVKGVHMDTTTILIIALVVVVIVVAIIAWFAMQKKRTGELREKFGPEYDRAVNQYGGQRSAESMLEERQKRVEALNIRPLSPEERGRFAEAWRSVQARFVDDPTGAITDADRLVNQVMQARGYPVGNFEQRAADISVDHPTVVTNYRAALAIAQANERGQATTEDLRKAMVHYRALFDDLLETPQAQQVAGSQANTGR